ncbi:hypothetical protein TNCV_2739101 [Trichonephila clavipes]|nr:hypothetical protein TNCV_2739101 [Trichonephila clavipes]
MRPSVPILANRKKKTKSKDSASTHHLDGDDQGKAKGLGNEKMEWALASLWRIFSRGHVIWTSVAESLDLWSREFKDR